MARVHNFSAGPAALPESVLADVAAELMDYRGCGMSVLEMSHRSATYQQIYDETEACLRRILSIPDTYRVLFLQGGATLEFAAIPMNLMRYGRAGYVVSGNFAKKAWQEAARYGEAELLATSEDTHFDRIPDLAPVAERCAAGDLDYVHICQNNTIFGTMYRELPDTGDVPLVADVSSCFLSLPLDVERYGLIYAGAQKNAGPAGVTVIIVREDLIADGPALPICPSYLNFRTQADKGSMLNTPNTFGIYLCGKVFAWIEQTGGLRAMEERNRAKAELLYRVLDDSALFRGTAEPSSRSIANVTFTCGDADLDAAFVAGAAERGIVGVGGHRLVGGMRASIYNAVSMGAVESLVSYMRSFEAEHAPSARSL
ncbi:3-phosphoserine/phosphohydroxythreonine transaminase [Collinsella tanakaei]|uniref:3-phosphoserine/phosphohydroxythreonine transaminase n=1 Tax=Collinsella tanakaei TaxID=626935 RepID=UPI00195D395E|nr:3-phosphoserine/phosphohydroxythreonine transaminase [Collinsella tanakaei]MBM6867345.1 3-phosphoserine/phosphohydroxythreonine transaminase [Collinsella tanakaei]